MISFVELAAESHNTALEKGWYERDDSGKIKPRDIDEVCALFHSEISEAVEELRNPMAARRPTGIYYADMEDDLSDQPQVFGGSLLKPEGVAVEFADLIIRLGDSAQSWDCADLVEKDLQYARTHRMVVSDSRKPIGHTSFIHQHISRLFERLLIRSMTDKPFRDSAVSLEIAVAVVDTERLCSTHKWDLERAIKLKMAYNKSRPFRHGGKMA